MKYFSKKKKKFKASFLEKNKRYAYEISQFLKIVSGAENNSFPLFMRALSYDKKGMCEEQPSFLSMLLNIDF